MNQEVLQSRGNSHEEKKKRAKSHKTVTDLAADDKKSKKRAKKATKDPVTERSQTPRVNCSNQPIKIVSWNVDGLRAPGRLQDLKYLIELEQPDVLCLQETKLQKPWEEDWQSALPRYDAFWACSREKKGYAGTAVFVKQPTSDAGTSSASSGNKAVGGGGSAQPPMEGDGVFTAAGCLRQTTADGKSKKTAQPKNSITSFFKPQPTPSSTMKKEDRPEDSTADSLRDVAIAELGSVSTSRDQQRDLELPKPLSALAPAASSPLPSSSSCSSSSSSCSTVPRTSLPHGLKVRQVKFGIGSKRHDPEGRSITVVFDSFFLVALYVPNAGMDLKRLPERLDEWNPALEAHVAELETSLQLPAVVCGDMNVAHRDCDVYNYFAPHIKKQAGCTVQEREAFSNWLKNADHPSSPSPSPSPSSEEEGVLEHAESSLPHKKTDVGGGGEGGYVDAFRHVHGDSATGAYTFWSTRSNNRPENKGMRLDYFVCSKALAAASPSLPSSAISAAGSSPGPHSAEGLLQTPTSATEAAPSTLKIVDSYILPETTSCSDHCPIALVLSE